MKYSVLCWWDGGASLRVARSPTEMRVVARKMICGEGKNIRSCSVVLIVFLAPTIGGNPECCRGSVPPRISPVMCCAVVLIGWSRYVCSWRPKTHGYM